MGKKIKVGKQRRDKFYHLAKEAGYRSRAAFKLIQLNKRFEFLQSSRALVDLCAAPGGWLQVASQNMPVSSIRIGVDLVPIKPIPNCITLQGDIREEKTRHLIIKELQNWEVDCVLNDGAPNVGLNWQHDAFQQNCLTLSALRLATRILRKNGYFVTKIFRSSDYLSLVSVFEKLFKKVHVWKPAASRLESAEIFVVCEKYVKPVKVDPDLLDTKKVFAEKVEEPKINPIRMLTARKKEKKKKADGYEEDDVTQFHVLKASEFVNGGDPLLMLSQASCFELDEEAYEKSPYLTSELRSCMADVKVCGPAELRSILQWRKKILSDIKKEAKEKEKAEKPEETEEQQEIRELEEIDELIHAAQSDEKAKIKKKNRQEFKNKQRLEERKKYEMVHKNDAPLVSEDLELFSLSAIRKQLKIQEYREQNRRLFNGEADESGEESEVDEEKENDKDDVEEEEMEIDYENDANPDALLKQNLVRELPASESEKATKWFSKVNDLLSDDEEEENSLAIVEKQLNLQKEKPMLDGKSTTKRKANEEKKKVVETKFDDKATSKKSISFDDSVAKAQKIDEEEEIEIVPPENMFDQDEDSSDDSETDNEEEEEGPSKKRPKYLTAEQLAMGEQMIYSAKKRKALEEAAFNRYTNNDEGLPDWFVADEKKHFRAVLPVSQKRIEYYQERNRELNARPIKKVLEANARKQKRRLRRIERVKKRAESILENENMEHQEKIREMKRLYKKAGKPEKKNVQYQVMTKGKRGKGTRPNGPYRVVDKRLKKDKRGMDKANKAKNAKNNSKGGRKNKKSRGGGPRPKSAKSRS